MYRVALIDDEPACLHDIQIMTERSLLDLGISPFECRIFNNARLFMAELEQGKPYDLVITDICLGREQNGVELAKSLRAQHPEISIILISEHEEYVFDGYDVQALYFFVKPVRQEKLMEIIARAIARRHGVQPLAFRLTDGQYLALSPDEILYFEHYYGKTRIICPSISHEIPKSLGELAKQLPGDRFILCHQSFIVNLSHVAAIERYKFTLKDGSQVPVSKLYYLQVRDRYEQYLISAIKNKPAFLF